MYSYKTFLGNIVSLNELSLRDYKAILKTSYGEEVMSNNFIESMLLVLVNNSQESKDFFLNLNLCDLINVLIELRANSMGNIASVVVPKDQTQTRIDIRLDWIQEDIKKSIVFCEEQYVELDEIKIYFGIPSLIKLISTLSEEEQFLCFLHKVQIKGSDNKVFYIKTLEDARKLLNMISAKNGKLIIDKFQDIVLYFQKQNFLTRYKIETQEQLKFVPSISSLLWYTKLMFNEPLDSLYHNIFMLAKYGNIDPNYLEKCTPGEYIYFVKKLEESLAAEGNDVGSSSNESS